MECDNERYTFTLVLFQFVHENLSVRETIHNRIKSYDTKD